MKELTLVSNVVTRSLMKGKIEHSRILAPNVKIHEMPLSILPRVLTILLACRLMRSANTDFNSAQGQFLGVSKLLHRREGTAHIYFMDLNERNAKSISVEFELGT